MPKRVLDFDAMWGSDKLASCAEWAQAEYAWLYGLADASGCFELTNLRVIWGRVAAVRRNLTIERLEQIFDEFQDKGLLFAWEHEGKRYGHWTGSDVPGRLPPPSWRMRLERLAPAVPKQLFAEYVSRFARGRAALPGSVFRGDPSQEGVKCGFEKADGSLEHANAARQRAWRPAGPSAQRQAEPEHLVSEWQLLKGRLEEDQAQDWNWDKNQNREGNQKASSADQAVSPGLNCETARELPKSLLSHLQEKNSKSEGSALEARADQTDPGGEQAAYAAAHVAAQAAPSFSSRDKASVVARELRVGQGPLCGPVKVRPEALERIRARDAARGGSRSP